MKQIFTLLIALCWLLPSAHADVRRTEAKDSLLRIYLASPADTTNYWKRPSPRKIYFTRVRPYMRTLFITTTYWTKNMQNNG